jgi:Fungal N-terminal domain of STAND proteins
MTAVSPTVSGNVFQPAITGCGNACRDFSKELAEIMSHSKDKEASKRDKIKLWIKEKEVLGFRYRLGSYKSTLNIVLTLASM